MTFLLHIFFKKLFRLRKMTSIRYQLMAQMIQEKMSLLTVRLYDGSKSRVDTRFLDMCCTSGQNSSSYSSHNLSKY